MNLPKTLQDRLDEYNKNFEALNNALGDSNTLDDSATAELQVEHTKAVLTAALPVAVDTLVGLAAYASSETTRLRASQYLIDRALGKDGNIVMEDDAVKLLKRLIVSEGR
jgi:hypothetical protein